MFTRTISFTVASFLALFAASCGELPDAPSPEEIGPETASIPEEVIDTCHAYWEGFRYVEGVGCQFGSKSGCSNPFPYQSEEECEAANRPPSEAAAADNCSYYSDATYTDIIGQHGVDCCNNSIHWGNKSLYAVCSFACLLCSSPPP